MLSDQSLRAEWETLEEIDQWFNQKDRSLAAFMTRQWRFRHGLAVFAAIFAVSPICIAVGIFAGSLPVIIAGYALFPVTPVIATLVVKGNSTSALRKIFDRGKA